MGSVRELAEKIKTRGILRGALRAQEPMSAHASFRIGGPADLFAAPETVEESLALLSLAAEASVPVFLLGGGTNILVADRGIRGLVLDLGRLARAEESGGLVSAMCGAPISGLSELALSRGLAGLEFCFALPGSVGGAVWMNARCYEQQASEALEFVDALDPTDPVVRRLPVRPEEWGYKRSPFQAGNELILRAGFRLSPGNPALIEEQMKDHRADRERKGHFLYPCAGSVFKNDRSFGAPTGKLIDSLGLKGRRLGGAQIAPFHGNIIVNLGGASAADVRALIELVESEVERTLGFHLEREVLLVGEWAPPTLRASW